MPRLTKAQTWTIAAGALAIAAGVWALTGTRVSLPTSAEDAVATLAGGELDALDADRRAAWMDEARRLLRDMPPDQRRALLSDEATRRAVGELMRDAIDERARAFARGEEVAFGFRRGERDAEGFRQMRERFEEMTEEDRRAMMRQRMEQAENDMRAQMSSGNAQSGGLRAEMGKRMGRGGGRGGR